MGTAKSWSVFLQLWSHRQDKAAITPITVLRPPLVPPSAPLTASRWAYGRAQRHNFNSAADLERVLAAKAMNQVKVKVAVEGYTYLGTDMELRSVEGYVYVSPTSELWADTRGVKSQGLSAERTQWTFESFQGAARGICDMPTSVSITLSVSTSMCYAAIQKELLTIFAVSLEGLKMEVECAGCADLFPEDIDTDEGSFFSPSGILVDLQGQEAFRALQISWDALHPILIGPHERCLELCQTLQLPVKIVNVGGRTQEHRYSIMSILAEPSWHTQEYPYLSEVLQRQVWGQQQWYSRAADLLVNPRDFRR